jgi:hypothetical protein
MLSSVEGFKSVVLDQLGEGVIIADADGRMISVNRAAEEIHGRDNLDVPPDAYSKNCELLTMDNLPYPPDELPLARAVHRGGIGGRGAVENPAAGWHGRYRCRDRPPCPQCRRHADWRGADDAVRVRAEQALVEALEMKDRLLFEVNHRVRNSLQIVSPIVSPCCLTCAKPWSRPIRFVRRSHWSAKRAGRSCCRSGKRFRSAPR